MKRNRTGLWKLAVPVGIGALAFFAIKGAQAKKTLGRQYVDPESGESKPLRPPPQPTGAQPPSPLATDIRGYLDGLSDDDLDALRKALPPSWWDHVHAAVTESSDEDVREAFGPMVEDYGLMSEEDRGNLRDGVLSAVGLIQGYRLNDLLERAGVIPS